MERELLNWESELLAKSPDWGKLGNVAMCCDAEGKSEAVVDTTLGREPAEGSEGGGSVLGAGTDEVVSRVACVLTPLCPFVTATGVDSDGAMELWYAILLCTEVWS